MRAVEYMGTQRGPLGNNYWDMLKGEDVSCCGWDWNVSNEF